MRSTKDIILSPTISVKTYTYLTGRESREIRRMIYRTTTISRDGKTSDDYSAEITLDLEDKLMDLLLISVKVEDKVIDDKAEVKNIILDLENYQVDNLVSELTDIYKKSERSPEDKKK